MPWAPGGTQGIGPQEAEGPLSRPTAIPTAIPARGLPRFFYFALPDTLEKNFVRDLASNFSK